MHLVVILLGTLTMPSSANGRLRDLFNKTADNNIDQLMDMLITAASNNINLLLQGEITTPVEELVSFWCGHGNSTELKDTVVDDPEVSSKLNLSKPVAFVTHGWVDDAKKLWVQEIAQKIIKVLNRNVCVVQWKQLAAYNYMQAAIENTMLVSDYLTKFISFLIQHGVELKDTILVGHSLGSHIMGQTGYNFNGEIGQIYGLDPARALFTVPVDRGLQFRLDSSDAQYVQMIITTRGISGVLFGEGHENFYPNGGTNPQPHCLFPLVTDSEFADQLLCSHMHATTLFRLSLSPWTLYLGNRCDSYAQFLLGMCDDRKSNNMGIYSDKAGGDFYLRTSLKTPILNHMHHLAWLNPNVETTSHFTEITEIISTEVTSEPTSSEETVQMEDNLESTSETPIVMSTEVPEQTTIS